MPDEAKTPDVLELQNWLGAVIQATDSSLLDEWTAMFAGGAADPASLAREVAEDPGVPDVTTDRHAFRALVRTRIFRWVQYAATGQWTAWSEDLTEVGDRGWNERKLLEQFEPYLEAYGDDAVQPDPDAPAVRPGEERPTVVPRPRIGIGGDARGPARFVVADEGDTWEIEQMRHSVDSTIAGFDDVVRSLPRAVGHERGERIHRAMLARGYDGTLPQVQEAEVAGRDWAWSLALPVAAALVSASAWLVLR